MTTVALSSLQMQMLIEATAYKRGAQRVAEAAAHAAGEASGRYEQTLALIRGLVGVPPELPGVSIDVAAATLSWEVTKE